MAARGSESKEAVMQKILEVFPEAFKHDKEIRIPMIENGEEIQIKCTLTAAKTNVERGSDTEVPGIKSTAANVEMIGFPPVQEVKTPVEPTEEEKQNVATFLRMMGM